MLCSDLLLLLQVFADFVKIEKQVRQPRHVETLFLVPAEVLHADTDFRTHTGLVEELDERVLDRLGEVHESGPFVFFLPLEPFLEPGTLRLLHAVVLVDPHLIELDATLFDEAVYAHGLVVLADEGDFEASDVFRVVLPVRHQVSRRLQLVPQILLIVLL